MGNSDFYRDLEDLEDLMEDAWHIPLVKNKCVVNSERFRDIMDSIRENIPMEMKKSREVLENKDTMLSKVKEDSDTMIEKARSAAENMLVKAKKNADSLIERAKVQAEQLVDEQQIMMIAKERAAEILERAKAEAAKMRENANGYVNGVLTDTSRALTSALSSVEKAKNSYEKK